MPKPDLNDVALFAAVAEAGGFRAAAEKRGLSASTLSEAVRRTEEALGARLLNRTTRSVTPTEAGRRLLARLSPALAEIDEAFDGLGGDGGEPAGTLRLNVPGVVARCILPPIAAAFLARHLAIRMEVTVDDSFVDVLAAGFDAGIRYGESLALDMIATPIGPRRQRFVAAASPAYLAARGTPGHPRELVRHARIGHRFAVSGVLAVWEFERGGETVRIPPEGQMISSSIDMEIGAAVAGLGIICAFEDFITAELKSGALVPVLDGWLEDFPGPLLYHQSRRHMPAPLRAFVDFVKGR